LVCVAVDLTAETEMIKTMTAQQWKKQKPELHKRPALFLIYAGS
jgi:16S rRNA (cytidine1402-2'-O)-methyltransferase